MLEKSLHKQNKTTRKVQRILHLKLLPVDPTSAAISMATCAKTITKVL